MDTPIIPQDTPYNIFVYEPAEDSFLLMDVLEKDLPIYFENFEDISSLEVGCGCGCISTAVAKFLPDKILPYIFAIDLNPAACFLTKQTSQINGVEIGVEVVIADGLKPCFKNKFDLVICNPPYVPVFPEEESTTFDKLNKSWDGGPDGNSFIIPFLTNLSNILSDEGALYLLLCSWNKPEHLMEKYAKPNGFNCHLLEKRAAGRERLSVWRLTKNKENNDNNNKT